MCLEKMTKLLQCHYPPVSPCPPSPPLLHLHLHQCCAQFTAVCPSPSPSLFPLSFPSLSSLTFVAPSPPPLPLFPLACRVCVCIHGGVLSSLPSLAPSLTYTTASLSPTPCSRSWLAPLRSPHCASFAFMTPLVIVFTFMTGPLPFAFMTVPVFVCRAGPQCPRLRLCCCQVRDWHLSWHALTDGLTLILALALHWPSTPTPMSGVHDTLRSRSLVLVFGVLCICFHGPSCLHLWPRVCGFAFVASYSWLHVRVCICGLAFVFVFVASHSCSCL
jgi:hypothetical protein